MHCVRLVSNLCLIVLCICYCLLLCSTLCDACLSFTSLLAIVSSFRLGMFGAGVTIHLSSANCLTSSKRRTSCVFDTLRQLSSTSEALFPFNLCPIHLYCPQLLFLPIHTRQHTVHDVLRSIPTSLLLGSARLPRAVLV